MKVSFSSISAAGPRSVNEDALDCWVSASGETVACIADGLGGMGGGDVASRLAIQKFREHLSQFGICAQTMMTGAQEAHHGIREAQSSGATSKMATTLTAVALSDRKILGIHCGDSRAVLVRGNGIMKLTKEHSEGQRLFEAGKLNKMELLTYKRQHILESALGDRENPRIDEFEFDLLPRDRVILTTDGVHNLIFLREMKHYSSLSSTPSELARRVTEAIERYGPTDNYSMIALYADLPERMAS